ncbi:YXWGXW repeat-containing protein [Alloacidobacterium dinghuense]|uniref:YXWGXW repeat-containing protein n=1 Tax=Alloacidobacterium dinghuense TaxID=2763107 RepID=A0A7G8BFC8_9BACT|nr:YXWGXW repeat-containing protein [Alloacidobacterium dinghuense]QNI31248.1 YXWGXW repeat-containing protein [Alloacidobacterium dinghuense]
MQGLLKIRNIFLALLLCAVPAASFAQISIGIGFTIHTAPPVLPVYAQPPCPADGYLWTPGYWAWGPDGYYWVPGVWVRPPQIGLLWTPGYWGFVGGIYSWRPGYWGPHVGFYGGVNYGYGYGGVGFVGGMWQGGAFHYNTAVVNVNTTIVHNTYINRTVINNVTVNNINRTSFNGQGGLTAQPSVQEQAALREQHFQATSEQLSHQNTASQDRNQLASVNHGRPATMAMNSVNGRRYDQQGRIANGVASGQLTAGETRNLENREANLNKEVHNDRQANGGTLTPQERQQVNRQQNNLSRSINDDKHNAATANYGNNQVGARRDEQQQRVAQGIRSGQMTPSETARTENREANINHQVATDRQANGGKLTPQEHQQINREQNGASRQIYDEKHNEKTAPR